MADYAAALEAYKTVLMEEYDKPVQDFDAARVCEEYEKVRALKPAHPGPPKAELSSEALKVVLHMLLESKGRPRETYPGETTQEGYQRNLKEGILLDKLCTWIFEQCPGDGPVRTVTKAGITFQLEGVCRCFNLYARREGAPDDKRIVIHLLRD